MGRLRSTSFLVPNKLESVEVAWQGALFDYRIVLQLNSVYNYWWATTTDPTTTQPTTQKETTKPETITKDTSRPTQKAASSDVAAKSGHSTFQQTFAATTEYSTFQQTLNDVTTISPNHVTSTNGITTMKRATALRNSGKSCASRSECAAKIKDQVSVRLFLFCYFNIQAINTCFSTISSVILP